MKDQTDEVYVASKFESMRDEIDSIPVGDNEEFIKFISRHNDILWPVILLVGWYKEIQFENAPPPSRSSVEDELYWLKHQIGCGCGDLTKSQKSIGMTFDDVRVEIRLLDYFLSKKPVNPENKV